jgi:hypothetical protein
VVAAVTNIVEFRETSPSTFNVELIVISPLNRELPTTVNKLASVAAPVTANVLPNVVAPVTFSVLTNVVAASVVAPTTTNGELNVVAPTTDKLEFNVVAPATVNVEFNLVAPATVNVERKVSAVLNGENPPGIFSMPPTVVAPVVVNAAVVVAPVTLIVPANVAAPLTFKVEDIVVALVTDSVLLMIALPDDANVAVFIAEFTYNPTAGLC